MRELTVVDSSVWIDHVQGRETAAVFWLRERLQARRFSRLVVPSLVLAEVFCGLDQRGVSSLEVLFSSATVSPELERSDFRAAADIFRECRRAGRTVRGIPDCLLAQLCLRYGYSMLTSDRDFDAIARSFPLKQITVMQ